MSAKTSQAQGNSWCYKNFPVFPLGNGDVDHICFFFSGLKINNHSVFQLRISLASPEETQLQGWERE